MQYGVCIVWCGVVTGISMITFSYYKYDVTTPSLPITACHAHNLKQTVKYHGVLLSVLDFKNYLYCFLFLLFLW